MVDFRRGFKTWCEKAARGFRRDLAVPLNGALCPRVLAQHLKILIWTPHDVARFANIDSRHLDQLLVHDADSWSAVTLMLPSQKLIVVNSTHAPVRQNSDIMHELSHLVLEHEPARVDMTSQKLMILDTYNKLQENEANWLAGALLVPRDGLLEVLSRHPYNEHAATHFKVSNPMIAWRRQVTGIDVQLQRRSTPAGN